MVRALLQTKCVVRMFHVVLAVTVAASLVSGCWPPLSCTGVYHCPMIPYVPGAVIESGEKYCSWCPVSVTYLGNLELAVHWSTNICFNHRTNLSVRLLTRWSCSPEFAPELVHTEYVVDKMALEQVFSDFFVFSPVSFIPPRLSIPYHTIHYLGAVQIGSMTASRQRYFLTPSA
jgi:hypothetical protein